MLVIMRGLPGSGKSTLANFIQMHYYHNSLICSTDAYFMKDGVYQFDASKLGLFHNLNKNKVEKILDDGNIPIVDNTNTTWKECKDYVKLAKKYNSSVIFYETSLFDAVKCFERGVHNVSLEILNKMVLGWQNTQYIIEQCIKLDVRATGIKMDITFDTETGFYGQVL